MTEQLLDYTIARYPGQKGKHTRTLQQRISDFWGYVNKNGPIPPHRPELGPCWVWTGGVLKCGGYGQFNINHKMWRCHRLSWILANGPIPEGMWVCHHCDTPRCVRIDHLFLGTAQDDVDDMISKGRERHPAGDCSPVKVLTEAEVYQMKVAWVTGSFTKAKLAKMFGITRGHVGLIIKGGLWKTVSNPPGWPGPHGQTPRKSVITPEIVRAIRLDRKSGILLKDIAAKYKTSVVTAFNIAESLSWKHVV